MNRTGTDLIRLNTVGEKAPRAFSIEELPGHLVGEVLTSGRLAAADLARLEATCFCTGESASVSNLTVVILFSYFLQGSVLEGTPN